MTPLLWKWTLLCQKRAGSDYEKHKKWCVMNGRIFLNWLMAEELIFSIWWIGICFGNMVKPIKSLWLNGWFEIAGVFSGRHLLKDDKKSVFLRSERSSYGWWPGSQYWVIVALYWAKLSFLKTYDVMIVGADVVWLKGIQYGFQLYGWSYFSFAAKLLYYYRFEMLFGWETQMLYALSGQALACIGVKNIFWIVFEYW